EFGADGRFSAIALPDELFTMDWQDWRDGGVTSTSGTWTLSADRGYVRLTPDHPTVGMADDAGLGVVETGHATRLCVLSGDPGVLCDSLLQRVESS
ncbi:hypothetical protein, partial [Planotetraspora thailandica]|uniref:hypothetical protein n=1 Tax=Planotetraspora thailandica TaxID=487172 RepID=UPI001952865D